MNSYISQDLERRLLAGEQLNIIDEAQEAYPDVPLELAVNRMRGRLAGIRNRLLRDGIVIVPTSEGIIGIPQTKQEVEYAYSFLQHRIQTSVLLAQFLHKYAEKKRILPEGFGNKRISLPIFLKGGEK